MNDKRINRIASAVLVAALLLALLLPLEESGKYFAAIFLFLSAIAIPRFIKKRATLSINKGTVLLIVLAIGLLYLMAFYLSGLAFGFYKNIYRLTLENFWRFFLPIAVIIVCTEIVRYVLIVQKDTATKVMCYLACIMADMLIVSNVPSVTTLNDFMDLVAGGLFPAILSNLLYNYLAARYGMYPNIVFKALTILHAYTFPITTGIEDSLVNLVRLLLPIGIYFFIDTLFEKKKKYALKSSSRAHKIASAALSAVLVVFMIGTVMLVSNHFKYGSLVIATESMTGELNKSDVVMFKKRDGEAIKNGEIIVFGQSNSMVVHRVVDIQVIDGVARYYTKGDANEDNDAGYITDSDIIGVVRFKIPYIGYPTLWMRDIFKK